MVDSETKTPLVLGSDGTVGFHSKEFFLSPKVVTNTSLVRSTRWFSAATISKYPLIAAKDKHSVRQKRKA